MKTQMTIAQARARIVKVHQEIECTWMRSCGRKRTDADEAGERLVLVDELVRLKLAVLAANLAHTVDFGGQRMTLAEALMRKDELKSELRRLRNTDDLVRIRRRMRLWRERERLCGLIDEANSRFHIHFG